LCHLSGDQFLGIPAARDAGYRLHIKGHLPAHLGSKAQHVLCFLSYFAKFIYLFTFPIGLEVTPLLAVMQDPAQNAVTLGLLSNILLNF